MMAEISFIKQRRANHTKSANINSLEFADSNAIYIHRLFSFFQQTAHINQEWNRNANVLPTLDIKS